MNGVSMTGSQINDIRIIGILVVILLLVIALIGLDWEAKVCLCVSECVYVCMCMCHKLRHKINVASSLRYVYIYTCMSIMIYEC